MGTIADKLKAVYNCKKAIKAAINTKGVACDNLLSAYAERIRQIPSQQYDTLNLSVSTNQSSNDDIIGKVISVTYGDITDTYTIGQDIKTRIPQYTRPSIVMPSVDGYKTPVIADITAVGGNTINVSAVYETEIVSVTLSAEEDGDVSGQIVTINGVDYTWQGVAISAKVPYGTQYIICTSDMDGYTSPSVETYTAGQVSREVALVYTATRASVSYVTINQTVSDPATMISGDVNGDAIRWIRNNTHRVLGKQTASGTVAYCQLLDTDSNYYYDGTTADLTGGEGDVFVKLPTFYYKAEETMSTLTGNIWKIGIALTQPDETWKTWDGNDLIGTYEAYGNNSKLYSRSGVESTGNVSQADFQIYARARGDGYTLVKWKHHCMLAFLFFAIYGNTDSQAICGAGTNSYTKNTGETDSLGMEDTVAGGNGDSGSINFLGLENWWGNKCEWIDNVRTSTTGWSIKEDDGTIRDAGKSSTASGYYIARMRINENLDMIPIGANNKAQTGYCDGFFYNNFDGLVVFRSYAYNQDAGGVAQIAAYYSNSEQFLNYGSRLAFRGTLIKVTNVTKFKAIEAIG